MAIAQDNTLGNLGSILSSIPGLAEAINGQTTTSNTSISSQGLTYLLQQILSGTNGLAAVAGAQNTAGIYNSTVQSQMVDQLLANSAGEVASKDATTTTTKQPTINLGQTLLQGAAGLIGTKVLSKGVDSLGQSLSSALGIGDTTTAGGDAAASSLLSATTGDSGAFAGSGVTAGASSAVADSTALAAGGADSLGTGLGAGVASSIGNAIGGTGVGAIGAGLGSALGITGAAEGAGATAALSAGGATLGGLGGAVAGDVAADTGGIAAAMGIGDAAAGAASAGGIGSALATIGSVLAWVVCTELTTTGEMDYGTYTKAAPDFIRRQKLKPSAVRGYHYWAVGYTRLMRKKGWQGKLARRVMRPIANGRARMINGEPNFWGYFTFLVIEPICSLLGNTVARKPQNWQSLYKSGE
jgi:hypothetical protein